MNKPYFDGIKPGDRVWSVVYGWGKVVRIDETDQPIQVTFDQGDSRWYRADGGVATDQLQTLFWDEVKITPPPKPKRMVTREQQVYFCRENYLDAVTVWGKEEWKRDGTEMTKTIKGTLLWEEEE